MTEKTVMVSLPAGDDVLADYLEDRGLLDAAMRVRGHASQSDKREILYSPGFGAGWVSWASGPREMLEFMLTYQPIIAFLNAGGSFADAGTDHPLLVAFAEECEKRGWKSPYLGGARDLEVARVRGRVRISEYDGNESYEEEDDYDGWL